MKDDAVEIGNRLVDEDGRGTALMLGTCLCQCGKRIYP